MARGVYRVSFAAASTDGNYSASIPRTVPSRDHHRRRKFQMSRREIRESTPARNNFPTFSAPPSSLSPLFAPRDRFRIDDLTFLRRSSSLLESPSGPTLRFPLYRNLETPIRLDRRILPVRACSRLPATGRRRETLTRSPPHLFPPPPPVISTCPRLSYAIDTQRVARFLSTLANGKSRSKKYRGRRFTSDRGE